MYRAFGILIAIAGLAASPALAQTITIDYAHEFDFDAVKTFQYVDTAETNATDALMGNRIVEMITKELVEGGLKEVNENPDLYVTYHVTTQEQQVINTTSFGYGGWGAGWYGWGGSIGTSSSTVSTYTDGTLIIDAYDPQEKKMVWRGTGTVTIAAKPQKRVKQVERILIKMGSRWDRILQNQGK